MPLTLVITRNVEDRYRGFLASVMLELAPGVYTSPRMSAAVRERLWSVMSDWHSTLGRGSVVMTWRDKQASGGQAVRILGETPRELAEVDGALLIRRELA
jgi:CRISPR-associated protein Cas2